MAYAEGTTPIEATLIEAPTGEGDAVVVNLPASSPEAEAQAETIETVTDSAVEIAQIEADRDVAVAEIHAETEQAHIEARAEREERDEEWRAETRDLREQIAALGEAVNATAALVEELVAQSTPPALPEAETVVITPESPAETVILTPETRTEPSSETETEAPVSVVVEKAPALSRRHHRMI